MAGAGLGGRDRAAGQWLQPGRAGQCSAVQCSAESRAVRPAARCSSVKAGLLPPVSPQCPGLSEFAALC